MWTLQIRNEILSVSNLGYLYPLYGIDINQHSPYGNTNQTYSMKLGSVENATNHKT